MQHSRQDSFVKTSKARRTFDDGYHKQTNTKKFKQSHKAQRPTQH